MNNITENQKLLQSLYDDVKAKLSLIFNNEDISIHISVKNLTNEELSKFSKEDKIVKYRYSNGASILEDSIFLETINYRLQ